MICNVQSPAFDNQTADWLRSISKAERLNWAMGVLADLRPIRPNLFPFTRIGIEAMLAYMAADTRAVLVEDVLRVHRLNLVLAKMGEGQFAVAIPFPILGDPDFRVVMRRMVGAQAQAARAMREMDPGEDKERVVRGPIYVALDMIRKAIPLMVGRMTEAEAAFFILWLDNLVQDPTGASFFEAWSRVSVRLDESSIVRAPETLLENGRILGPERARLMGYCEEDLIAWAMKELGPLVPFATPSFPQLDVWLPPLLASSLRAKIEEPQYLAVSPGATVAVGGIAVGDSFGRSRFGAVIPVLAVGSDGVRQATLGLLRGALEYANGTWRDPTAFSWRLSAAAREIIRIGHEAGLGRLDMGVILLWIFHLACEPSGSRFFRILDGEACRLLRPSV